MSRPGLRRGIAVSGDIVSGKALPDLPPLDETVACARDRDATRVPPESPSPSLTADFARSVRGGSDPVCTVHDAEVVGRLVADAHAFATRLEEHP
ncbi:hypothetical protein AB0F88_15005 [Streptosporangium sp. NPDC023963]|uniref:hypothetical protein n=1 Tax=Streptosporangium sp. NPDC023963 TaxID=3155608 RepID=UPI00341B20A1